MGWNLPGNKLVRGFPGLTRILSGNGVGHSLRLPSRGTLSYGPSRGLIALQALLRTLRMTSCVIVHPT